MSFHPCYDWLHAGQVTDESQNFDYGDVDRVLMMESDDEWADDPKIIDYDEEHAIKPSGKKFSFRAFFISLFEYFYVFLA